MSLFMVEWARRVGVGGMFDPSTATLTRAPSQRAETGPGLRTVDRNRAPVVGSRRHKGRVSKLANEVALGLVRQHVVRVARPNQAPRRSRDQRYVRVHDIGLRAARPADARDDSPISRAERSST